jgi:hypothetical protein
MFLPRQLTPPLLTALLAVGCNSQQAFAPGPGVDATVRFASTVEGGCWSVATTTQVYEPVDLPTSFRIDGLAVHVVLRDAPDWGSICMIGPLVHVDSIRTR